MTNTQNGRRSNINVFDQYFKIEVELNRLLAIKSQLREQITKEIKSRDESIEMEYGTFIKTTSTTWTYSENLQKEEAKAIQKIKDIKAEIESKKEKARVLGRAKSDSEIGFRFSIKK